MSVLPLQRDVFYPESDGQPMAETWLHVEELMALCGALKDYYRDNLAVLVGSNFFLYYVEGEPRYYVSPDVAVFLGVRNDPSRRIYKLWEEGKPPALVIEVTSPSTRGEDLNQKKDLYERLGVEDYFLYDLLEEYLKPPLQGFRRVNGRYQAIQADADGCLPSQATGLKLRVEDRRLRLIDAATGKPLLRPDEVSAARQALEEEVARLRQELDR